MVLSGAGWPGGPWLWFCAGEIGWEWARSTANARTSISAAGKLEGLLSCIPLPAEAEAGLCPLSQASLGLFPDQATR